MIGPIYCRNCDARLVRWKENERFACRCLLSGSGVAGLFCLWMLALILVPVLLVGALAGGVLRRKILRTRAATVTAAIVGLVALTALDRATVPTATTETVATSITVEAPPADVWREIVFFEDIAAEPPWLLRLGLPTPVGTRGARVTVGDVVRCLYEDDRWLEKRILTVAPARRLAFRVTGQHLHFEHDVALEGGAFDLEPAGAGSSRLTLTTDYRPRCHPRWLWRPLERMAVTTLHQHVAATIRARATARSPQAALPPAR